MEAIEKARQAVGGGTGLARLLVSEGIQITSQAVNRWKRVPTDRARDVARLTGVPLHELRPDLWESPAGISTSQTEAAA